MSQVPTQTPAPAPAATPSSTPSSEVVTPATDSFLADEPIVTEPVVEPGTFSAPTDVEEIEYDLELAEDSLVPDDEFDALVEEAKTKGLSKDEAEARLKLLDSAYTKSKDVFMKSESKRLMQELVSDPEFNTPEKQKEAKKNIDAVYAAYKDPDFMKFVKGNPLVGNNKHFVKFMAKLGQSLAQEGAPKGDGSTPPTPPQKAEGLTALDLYPSMREK